MATDILNKKDIIHYAQRYDEVYKDIGRITENQLKEWLRINRFLSRDRFIELCNWKTARQRKRYQSNDESFIIEITTFSFKTTSEEARLKSLTVLNGVSYAVASAILHFAFPDRYPILDFRVLWSLGVQQPTNYSFDFRQEYCDKIREISKKLNLDIRTIDKALWQYSKENQPRQ